MVLLGAASIFAHLLNFIVLALSLFIILLVLIQRGKGGGLAGAFGGMGGASPFGSRAGDTFTWITLGTAGVWVLVILLQVMTVQGTTGTETLPVVGGR